MNSAEKKYDLVIAGGGMVGLSLALTFASQPECSSFSILLVDCSPFIKKPAEGEDEKLAYHPSFDARASALSLSSIKHYSALGFVDKIIAYAEPIKTIHVSDKGHIGNTLLDCQNENLEALGYVVENQWLGRVLLQQTARFPNIEIASASTVKNFTPKIGGVSVTVSQNEPNDKCEAIEFTAFSKLLVIADGASSSLRKKMGIAATANAYEQTAIVANIVTQKPHQGRAFERFTASGAVALLPLPELPDVKNRSALVWTMSSAEAEVLATVNDEAFMAALQVAFGDRLGEINKTGVRHSYPLSLELSKEECRSNIVLIGNAVHALHPVAGQGFNLSLRDVAALVNCLASACREKKDIGSLDVLETYVGRQSLDQTMTIGFSHHLIQLYRNKTLAVQASRSLGLLLLDVLSLPKNEFVRQATGLAGRKNI